MKNLLVSIFKKFTKAIRSFRTTCASYPLAQKPPTKIQIGIWGVLLVLNFTLAVIKFNTFQLGTYIDDANYVILAKSIVSSPYYGLINRPIENAQSQFPFGFPLLLSLSASLFPGNTEIMKIYSLIATLINVSVLFWGWRLLSHIDSYWMGLVMAGLYSVFPLVIQQSSMVMSEPVFLTFYLLALILTEKAARGEENRWWIVEMSVLAVFVIFTRTIGAVFILCIIIYLLFVRGWRFGGKLALVCAGAFMLTSLIIWFSPLATTDLLPREYFRGGSASQIMKILSIFSPVLKSNDGPLLDESGAGASVSQMNVAATGNTTHDDWVVGFNLPLLKYTLTRHFGGDLREVVLPFGEGSENTILGFTTPKNILIIVGFLVSVIVMIGFIRLLIQYKLSIFIFSSVAYFAALMLWVWEGPRLLYPILPQMQFGFLIGMIGIISLFTSSKRIPFLYRNSNLLLTLVIIFLFTSSIYKSSLIDDSQIHAGDIRNRTNWLNNHIDPPVNLMSEYPEVDYLYTNFTTIPFPYYSNISSPEDLENYMTDNNVDYVLMAPQINWQPIYSPSYSDRTLHILLYVQDLASKNKLTLIYESDSEMIRIYKRVH